MTQRKVAPRIEIGVNLDFATGQPYLYTALTHENGFAMNVATELPNFRIPYDGKINAEGIDSFLKTIVMNVNILLEKYENAD